MNKNFFNNFNYRIRYLSILIFTFIILILFLRPKQFLNISYVDNFLITLGFELKDIDIIGNKNLINEDIIVGIEYHSCKNLFCINLNKSKELIQDLPWVNNVSLKLLLPSKLEIKIKEESPSFILKKSNRLYLLNSKGDIIVEVSSYEKKYSNLIILNGTEVEKNIEELIKVLEASPNLAKKITQATYISNRRWSLIYKSNLLIELPEENPEYAFKKINEINKKHGLLSNKLEKIDLRVKNRMIIKLKTQDQLIKESKI